MTRYAPCEALNLTISQALYHLACHNNLVNCAELTPMQFSCSVETISYAICFVIVMVSLVLCIVCALYLLGLVITLIVFFSRITVLLIQDLLIRIWVRIQRYEPEPGEAPPPVKVIYGYR
jgi:hypothetical protein